MVVRPLFLHECLFSNIRCRNTLTAAKLGTPRRALRVKTHLIKNCVEVSFKKIFFTPIFACLLFRQAILLYRAKAKNFFCL